MNNGTQSTLAKPQSSIRLGIALFAVLAASTSTMTIAQVAPTEVNEEAVDEFGMERKTGRFSWSTGEIIGIGDESSRISISATGVRTPPHASTQYPANLFSIEFNQPRLTIAPKPENAALFPGAIDPNRNYVTVDYSGGSHTFECTAVACISKYFEFSALEPTTNGYFFTSPQGVTIDFSLAQSVTTYPDGRQMTVTATGVWKNNFGYMLRYQPGSASANVAAVNRAVDYCNENTQTVCSGIDEARNAGMPTSFVSPMNIVDAVGGITKLRWGTKTAKEYRPPSGDPGTIAQLYPTNLNLTSRYPLGITLPGSTSEDVTITYSAHDPSNDTHDDIRVSSITKNGVTVDYEVVPYFPFGNVIEVADQPHPDGGDGIFGITTPIGMTSVELNQPIPPQPTCYDIAPRYQSLNGDQPGFIVCDYPSPSTPSSGGGGITVPQIETMTFTDDDPYGPTSSGSNFGKGIYELTITARIAGEIVSTSKAFKPHTDFGMARRRLETVSDGLGRETRYIHNFLEEFAGVIQPEGNAIFSEYDPRGNIVETVIRSKNYPTEPDLVTTLIYPTDCTSIPLPRCNRPLTVTDARGNTTDFTYNDFGQVLTEIGPAPTSGAARPKVINTYTMRTAYVKSSSGGVVAAGPPISMLTRTSTCISQASCVGTNDEIVTEYDYGPTTGLNNLLLRGMTVTAVNASGQMETLRTCYKYNYFGERIAETLPKAGLTSCPA